MSRPKLTALSSVGLKCTKNNPILACCLSGAVGRQAEARRSPQGNDSLFPCAPKWCGGGGCLDNLRFWAACLEEGKGTCCFKAFFQGHHVKWRNHFHTQQKLLITLSRDNRAFSKECDSSIRGEAWASIRPNWELCRKRISGICGWGEGVSRHVSKGNEESSTRDFLLLPPILGQCIPFQTGRLGHLP